MYVSYSPGADIGFSFRGRKGLCAGSPHIGIGRYTFSIHWNSSTLYIHIFLRYRQLRARRVLMLFKYVLGVGWGWGGGVLCTNINTGMFHWSERCCLTLRRLHLKIVELWCLCCMMMFRWTIKQPGMQKFWNFCGLYQDVHVWLNNATE